jgi:hypothetical protein
MKRQDCSWRLISAYDVGNGHILLTQVYPIDGISTEGGYPREFRRQIYEQNQSIVTMYGPSPLF